MVRLFCSYQQHHVDSCCQWLHRQIIFQTWVADLRVEAKKRGVSDKFFMRLLAMQTNKKGD